MQWASPSATPSTCIHPVPDELTAAIDNQLALYLQRTGWLSGCSEEGRHALIESARQTEERILADGLDSKPGGSYHIFLIPSEQQWPLLHPTQMRPLLRDLLDQRDNNPGWGYVNDDYYGTSEAPKHSLTVNGKKQPIASGFTACDIGKIGFLVEDQAAPGHNPEMIGSLLADMPWGEERLNKGLEWAARHPKAQPQFVNYATHGLFCLAASRWDDALGQVGWIDYITQPYDAKRGLCPCGDVRGGEAYWCVRVADAHARYAAAAVVW